jgi:transposase
LCRIRVRLANVPPCLIGIEAGMATHYVARELLALGHDVRQVPPAYAKPFRQAHKNAFRDAYAIAEAVRRPTTRCVPVCFGGAHSGGRGFGVCSFPITLPAGNERPVRDLI